MTKTTTKPKPTKAPKKPAKPSLWSRLTSWLRGPLDLAAGVPDEMAGWLRSAQELARNEGRAQPTLDDLFLSLGHDEDLAAFVAGYGVALEDLVDDVRMGIDEVEVAEAADFDRDVHASHRFVVAACAHVWVSLQGDPEASRAVALFLACLRPGPPSLVRESFERRTGTTLHALRFKQAHSNSEAVDVGAPLVVDPAHDDGAPSRRAYVVVYNDPFTTQEFVLHAFLKHARLTPADARSLMLAVHRFGVAVIAEGLHEEMAELKRALVDDARSQGAPLRVRLEPVQDGLDP